jgi:hypothetical protein
LSCFQVCKKVEMKIVPFLNTNKTMPNKRPITNISSVCILGQIEMTLYSVNVLFGSS